MYQNLRNAPAKRPSTRLIVVVGILSIVGWAVLAYFVSRASSVAGQWYDRNGRPLPDGSERSEQLVLDVYTGHSHCDWQNVVFMELGWPPGSVVSNRSNFRQYIRNPGPGRVPQEGLPETYVRDAKLPNDAFDTGFHRGDWHLWVSPSHADKYIYLVNGDRAERWTRSRHPTRCA